MTELRPKCSLSARSWIAQRLWTAVLGVSHRAWVVVGAWCRCSCFVPHWDSRWLWCALLQERPRNALPGMLRLIFSSLLDCELHESKACACFSLAPTQTASGKLPGK